MNNQNYPIHLTDAELKIIKFCKMHYNKSNIYKTRHKNPTWVQSFMPLFEEIYGWSSRQHYNDFLGCVFNKLLEIQTKISDDQSGRNLQLNEVFQAAFQKSWRHPEKKPVERAIAQLASNIRHNIVRLKDGTKRYELLDDETGNI